MGRVCLCLIDRVTEIMSETESERETWVRLEKKPERATGRWVKSQYTEEVQRGEGERRGEINRAAEVRGREYATLERECMNVCVRAREGERDGA